MLICGPSNSDNGKPLNLKGFEDTVAQLRKGITNRQLVTQDVLFAPADKQGLAGTAAHTAQVSGIEDGNEVDIKVVSVVRIDFVEGRRRVEVESFVVVVERRD